MEIGLNIMSLMEELQTSYVSQKLWRALATSWLVSFGRTPMVCVGYSGSKLKDVDQHPSQLFLKC